jgi:hypothetical protein
MFNDLKCSSKSLQVILYGRYKEKDLERQQDLILSKCHILIYMHIIEVQNIVCVGGTQINFQKCLEVKPCHNDIIIVVMGEKSGLIDMLFSLNE